MLFIPATLFTSKRRGQNDQFASGHSTQEPSLSATPSSRFPSFSASHEKTSERRKDRYRLRSPKKGTSRLIGGRPFFAHHGIPVESAQMFEVEAIEDGLIGFRLANSNGGGDAAK